MRRKLTLFGLLLSAIGTVAALLIYNSRELTRERQWPAQPQLVGSLLYSPDGKTLFSSGDAIRLWDPATGTLKSTLGSDAELAGISPAGNVLACTASRRVSKRTMAYSLELWDLTTSTPLPGIDHYIYAVAFSPDSKTLATLTSPIDGGNSTIELWALPGLTPIKAHRRPTVVRSLCFSPDGKALAATENNLLHLLDPQTGKSLRTLSGPTSGALGLVRFSPDGKTIVASIDGEGPQGNGGFWTWDLATAQPLHHIDFGRPTSSTCLSPDARLLVTAPNWYIIRNQHVDLWDTTTGRKISTVKIHEPFISALALSPDDAHLAIGFQPLHFNTPAPIDIWHID